MRILRKFLRFLLVLIILLGIVYFVGPRVEKPDLNRELPQLTSSLIDLQKEIDQREAANPNIKPDNQSQIVWYDSIPTRTKYSIVYMHGWSASHEEGAPLHEIIGRRYGANVYLPRLAGHGIVEEHPMLDLSATDFYNSAKQALAVAKQLGEKVIVVGTSTGGTLALYLAGGDPDVAALLLFSPNVAIYDPSASLLSGPWGLQLVKKVTGSDYHQFEADSIKQNYWTTKYHLEALTHLQALIDNTMKPEVFKAVSQPTFMGYYYKDEENQDKVVSVPAMLEMFDELGVDGQSKRKMAFPNVNNHVMTSHITSKDFESVKRETFMFLEEVVKLQPLE